MNSPPQHLLGGLNVAILVVNGFEQVEMTAPRKALEELGVTTRLISVNTGHVQGYHHDKPGDHFDVDLTFDEARADAFDQAVVVDGNWVSSRKPADIPAFNEAFKDLLACRTAEGVAGSADDADSAAGTGG